MDESPQGAEDRARHEKRVMRVLLLGGSGFVGRHLRRALRRTECVAPSRREIDITVPASICDAIRRFKPDIVVNAAASTGIGAIESSPDAVFSINAAAPAAWAAGCAEMGVRFVHFSTDQVFPGDKGAPYVEDDLPGAVSLYGKSKQEGEAAVLEFSRHLVVRTSFVFGEDGNNFMSRLPRLLAAEESLRIVSDIRGSCVYVETLCAVTARLALDGATGLFHVINAGEATWVEFADRCADEMRRQGIRVRCCEIAEVSYGDMKGALGPRALYSVLDDAKLAGFLGKAMPAWQTEIPEFVRRSFAASHYGAAEQDKSATDHAS